MPVVDVEAELAGTTALSHAAMTAMEGVYRVTDGRELLGPLVVVKRTGTTLSVFTDRDILYSILQGGSSDSTLRFVGTWRKAVSLDGGIMRLSVNATEGGRILTGRSIPAGGITLHGTFTIQGSPDKACSFTLDRPLAQGGGDFQIIAHRAGGRNSDHLPASENSVELALIAERFGATGIEIDVQLTRDGIPIVYHDENLNLRLNQKNGLVGPVGDYTLAQIESFVRLVNGERIPTLRRMLSNVLRRTGLRVVWLDSKPSMPVSTLRDVQRVYQDSARALGRDLRIIIGLPSTDKVNEWEALHDRPEATVLCELDADFALRIGADIWAPRWTLGTQNDAVDRIHAAGRLAWVWTLDDPGYVKRFITDGHFDGILTNYPSIVAFHHYAR